MIDARERCVAAERLQAAQERKSYLDAQAKDLSEALGTLDDAIRRIDKESVGGRTVYGA